MSDWKNDPYLRKRVPDRVPRSEDGSPDLSLMPAFARNVLTENPQASWHWEDDVFVRALCSLEYTVSMTYRRWQGKVYVDPPTGEVFQGWVQKRDLENSMLWECAVCGEGIRPNYKVAEAENFVCEGCREAKRHLDEKGNVKREVLDSAMRMFTEVRRHYNERVGSYFPNQKKQRNGKGKDKGKR